MEDDAAMKTIVNLPDSLFEKSQALAASRGATVEQFIVEAITNEVRGNSEFNAAAIDGNHEVELPVIRSKNPGTLDLSRFDFDKPTCLT